MGKVIYLFFFKFEILIIFKIDSRVAILKVEHCGFLHLVAYLYFHKNGNFLNN